MSENDILKKKEFFVRLLQTGRLHDAFALLRQASERHLTWEITDDINSIEREYRCMLEYAVSRAQDSNRANFYNDVIARLLRIFNRLVRQIAAKDDSRMYYSVLRSYGRLTVKAAIDQYLAALRKSDSFAMALSDNPSAVAPSEIESLERTLFNVVWVSYPLTKDSRDDIKSLLASEAVPSHVKMLVVSALTLGNMMFADEYRYEILSAVYSEDADAALSLRALVGIVLSLYLHRDEPTVSRSVEMMLNVEQELGYKLRSDLKNVFLEVIRTRDTERITRKMRDEVVPDLLKIKSKFPKEFNQTDFTIDINDIEENPEWADMLEQSGMAEKMRELSEIQEEGGDVFMATFAQLKTFAFFYEPANWFLPFRADHSEVARLGDDSQVVTTLLSKAPMFCESDKYSFILAVGQVPEAQRKMMLSQLEAQNINMAELQNATLDLGDATRRNIINKYVQDLYRFFRLYRRHDDFDDPFATELNLAALPLLRRCYESDDTLQLVAQFYFSHKYYREALDVYRAMESSGLLSEELYQKMGFCNQSLGNLPEALRYYEQAELLNGKSLWTLRRLAQCNRRLRNYEAAIGYYNRVDAIQPDKFSVALALGECYAVTGRYDDAIAACYKAIYLDEKSTLPWRPLAWSLMINGDNARADEYFKKILTDNPSPADYLNIGHFHLLNHNPREAVNAYIASIKADSTGFDRFVADMKSDSDALVHAGLEADIIPLTIDAVRYAMD